MLFEDIKKAGIDALKARDKVARAIYEVVINKCQVVMVEKRAKNEEFLDSDVLQILQKVVKELNEEKENYLKVNNTEEVSNIERQIEIVKNYLPKMMTESEIKEEINKLDDKSIGSVMKHFKQNFNGKCDMRQVQEVLKELG